MGTPVRAKDLVPYWSLLRAADDLAPTGGGIDAQMRVLFLDITPAPTDVIEVVSSGLDTTQTITIVVMTADGLVLTESQPLRGLLPIDFNSLGAVNRIESAVLSGTCSGTVTIRTASNLAVLFQIPPGELGFRRMFYQATPNATTTKAYYEKFFWKNLNTTTAVTSTTLKLVANPSNEIAHCVASSINDTGQTPNRVTAPTSAILAAPFLFNGVTQDVPGAAIPPLSAIGVWVQLTLQAAPIPLRSSFTSQILGATPF